MTRRLDDIAEKVEAGEALDLEDGVALFEEPDLLALGQLADGGGQDGPQLAALEQLRPEQQRILQLSIYHGRSHEEISRSTGLPLGTVKTHARRGLIRLREILEAEGALERGLKRDVPVDGEPKAGNPPKSSQ